MRRLLRSPVPAVLAASVMLVALAPTGRAGVPGPTSRGGFDPARSSVEIRGQGTACHFRFAADGALDAMTVFVTLRDPFDVPVPNCTTTVTLVPDSELTRFCSCCPNPQFDVTNEVGASEIVFDRLGGRGPMVADVEGVSCVGEFLLVARRAFTFTSPDLDASCEPEPAVSTTVIDLGLWARGIDPYAVTSDYNCDATVNVIDLGIWAKRGLFTGCVADCP